MLAQEISLDDISLTAPMLQRLYADWMARRRDGIPRRADFDPASLGYVLGSMSLFEVWRNPLRFKCRVHGTGLAIHLGMELTGKFLDEAPDTKYFRLVAAHFTDVVTRARPSFSWLMNESRFPPVRENEALVLPLSRNGDSVDYLLSAVVHYRHFSLNGLQHPRHLIAPLDAA